MVSRANKEGKTTPFANLVDLCHLKNAEVARDLHKYDGRVVLLGDNVKDECGDRAVFAEQGFSASQMAAAQFVDTTSKFLGMTGGASEAVSAHMQVKMIDAPRLLKLPENYYPDISMPSQRRPKAWDSIDDHSLAGLFRERKLRSSTVQNWMGESTNMGMCVCTLPPETYAVSFFCFGN